MPCQEHARGLPCDKDSYLGTWLPNPKAQHRRGWGALMAAAEVPHPPNRNQGREGSHISMRTAGVTHHSPAPAAADGGSSVGTRRQEALEQRPRPWALCWVQHGMLHGAAAAVAGCSTLLYMLGKEPRDEQPHHSQEGVRDVLGGGVIVFVG